MSAAHSFSTLPRELQDQILSNTNLVLHDHPERWGSGLHVYDGVITPKIGGQCDHGPECNCADVPTEDGLLSKENPALSQQAREILLSRNRIVLAGAFPLSLKWLKEQGDLVQKIRALDLKIDDDFTVPKEWTKQAEWEELVAYVGDNLLLSNLELSIDHGEMAERYQLMNYDKGEEPDVLEIYGQIVKPFRTLGQKGLKKFNVFWACYHDNEDEAEKYVMGADYTPEGKIPPEKRHGMHPHGVPEGWDPENVGMELA
jgi:hypothetical protein